MVTAKLVA